MNKVTQAADALAEIVSCYLEGRADMDELRESCIGYYQAKERALQNPARGVQVQVSDAAAERLLAMCEAGGTDWPVRFMIIQTPYGYKLIPRNADGREGQGIKVFAGLGPSRQHPEESTIDTRPNAKLRAMPVDLPPYAKAPETQGYYICTGGLVRCADCRCGKPMPPPSWSEVGLPPKVFEFPVKPSQDLGMLTPIAIPPMYWREVKEGMSFKADGGEFIAYGQIAWEADKGSFVAVPAVVTDRAGVAIARKGA